MSSHQLLTQAPKASLLGLPPELRLQIYDILNTSETSHRISDNWVRNTDASTEHLPFCLRTTHLALTCSLIANELGVTRQYVLQQSRHGRADIACSDGNLLWGTDEPGSSDCEGRGYTDCDWVPVRRMDSYCCSKQRPELDETFGVQVHRLVASIEQTGPCLVGGRRKDHGLRRIVSGVSGLQARM